MRPRRLRCARSPAPPWTARLRGYAAALFGAGGWRFEEEADRAGQAAVASGAVKCVLTPEQTEGPYYIPNERIRRNITDGRPGTPLLLRAFVVDASTCRAIKNAAVDVW